MKRSRWVIGNPWGAPWYFLLIVLVVFGARRIPELGRGLGKGIKNFTSALKGDDEEDEKKRQHDDR